MGFQMSNSVRLQCIVLTPHCCGKQTATLQMVLPWPCRCVAIGQKTSLSSNIYDPSREKQFVSNGTVDYLLTVAWHFVFLCLYFLAYF